jgi:hypothetical protein
MSSVQNPPIQGESLSRGPKLLSIKNYVIEIMIYIHIPGTMRNVGKELPV